MAGEKNSKINKTISVDPIMWGKFMKVTDEKFMNKSKILNHLISSWVKENETSIKGKK